MPRFNLFSPGPVNISDPVRRAMLLPDISHRQEEFINLAADISSKIRLSCGIGDDYAVFLLCGSGTAAMEAVISSLTSRDGRLVIINNGLYGERICTIASAYGIEYVELKYSWGTPPIPSEVKHAVEDAEAEMIVAVHHETSTGLLNPLEEIGKIAAKYGKTFVIDAISSLFGERVDFHEANIGAAVTVANKCLQSVPGVGIAIIKKELSEKAKRIQPRNYYLCLTNYLEMSMGGEPPFTPPVQVLYALDAALDCIIETGVEERVESYHRLASLVRNSIEEMGLELYLRRESYGNTVTSVCLPPGVTYVDLHDCMKTKGFIIYPGCGDMRGSVFRIANMSNMNDQTVIAFLHSLRVCVNRLRNRLGDA